MNRKYTFYPPTLAAVGLGLAGLALRRAIYTMALDERNLLIPGHPLTLALWGLGVAAAAFLFWTARKSRAPEPAGLPAALGEICMAVGMAATVLTEDFQILETAWRVLGLAAAACCGAAAFLPQKKDTLPLLRDGGICLFLCVHCIGRYQLWSGDPQMHNYLFSTLGCCALAIQAYCRCARRTGMEKPRAATVSAPAAVLCCLTALAATDSAPLYLGGALWALLGSLGRTRHEAA